MPSLANIPEPTSAHHAVEAVPDAPVRPMPLSPSHGFEDGERLVRSPADHDLPQQQIDSVSGLLLLMIAGALLRGVLGLFGPMQGLDPTAFHIFADRGREAVNASPSNVYPLFDALALGVESAGTPTWFVVAIGSLLTLAAIPAAYIIGYAATERRVAGLLGASLVAVHPAVLTAANALTGTAVAMGLLTIGLALVCHSPRRGSGYALSGGLLLGLAGLTAPLCWLAGVMAAPFVYRLTLKEGKQVAFGRALLVLVFAVVPVFGFRVAFFGADASALVPEFVSSDDTIERMPPMSQMLITMTDPSLAELGEALHLPLGNAGYLTVAQDGTPIADEDRDIVADILADSWLLLNAGLAGLAAISFGVMVVRRRVVEVLALALPLVAIGFCVLPPSESLRLPMIALVGVLAAGLLAKPTTPVLTAEERAAKKQAKLEAKEEKQRAKMERNVAKHKDSLYAFDKPSRKERKQLKRLQAERAAQAKQAQAAASVPAGIQTQRPIDDEPVPARPI